MGDEIARECDFRHHSLEIPGEFELSSIDIVVPDFDSLGHRGRYRTGEIQEVIGKEEVARVQVDARRSLAGFGHEKTPADFHIRTRIRQPAQKRGLQTVRVEGAILDDELSIHIIGIRSRDQNGFGIGQMEGQSPEDDRALNTFQIEQGTVHSDDTVRIPRIRIQGIPGQQKRIDTGYQIVRLYEAGIIERKLADIGIIGEVDDMEAFIHASLQYVADPVQIIRGFHIFRIQGERRREWDCDQAGHRRALNQSF
ncbi:MAG TPA: hypothetical protein VJ385_09080 [Fibrobacteria bacterium]|nr:hypothetical protein [Fibrobacteria bacterium]